MPRRLGGTNTIEGPRRALGRIETVADGSRSFAPPQREDLERIATLYREHHRFVGRVLRRCGIPDGELDDALQETFLVAYRRLSDFEGRSTERTWLYAIAVRVASTLRRGIEREHARREKAGDAMHGKLDLDPEAELTRAQAARVLDDLLDQLDDNKRTVFVLAELEGLKAPEISRIVGVNVRTVHSRLRLAREGFASAIERLHAQERGRRRRSQLRARSLAARAEPPRSTAALGLVLAKIETGAAPLLPGWKAIAIAPVVGSSFLVPLAATLAVGGVGLAVTAQAVDRPEPAPIEASHEARDVAERRGTGERRETDARARPQRVVEPAGEADAAAPMSDPAPTAAVSPPSPPSNTPPTPTASTSTRPPTVETPRQAEPAQDPSEASAAAQLAEETESMMRARKAMRSANYEAALVELDAHARRFASGLLAAEREETRIKALCSLGRTDDARAVLQRNGLAADSPAGRIFAAHCEP